MALCLSVNSLVISELSHMSVRYSSIFSAVFSFLVSISPYEIAVLALVSPFRVNS